MNPRRGRCGSILKPGRNVWRVEQARRVAVLIDGAAFFDAVRAAFLNAQRSIFIVGWDIDGRTRLVGEHDCPDDGYSPILAEFLTELVDTRPDLHVHLLLWDYSIIYASERELFPRLSLGWNTPPRVTLCLDGAVPFGSSQHQKLIVVDDAIAFSGGLDLTLRRWDTSEHRPVHPRRIDDSKRGYPPFHDVAMMADFEVARALAVLARRRWCRAGQGEPPLAPIGDPWPRHVTPHFTDVRVGIARTEPAFGGQQEVREVQNLFFDCIDRAETTIYLENQFLSSMDVARRIALKIRERPNLQVLAISSRSYDSWAVDQSLGSGRDRFLRLLRRACADRVRLLYPVVGNGKHKTETNIHSKVMIIDDLLLRVGSANLNNRSMAVDTECDLVIEAQTETERAAIARIRNMLLADHCGVQPDVVASELAEQGSLLRAADRLPAQGHALFPIPDNTPRRSLWTAALVYLADPKRPVSASGVWRRVRHVLSRAGALALALTVVLGLILLWRVTPLSELVTAERVEWVLTLAAGSSWAPLWVLLTYVIAGLVEFPVLLLILATTVTFGPWLGFVYALVGVLVSAVLTYFLGTWFGRVALQKLLGGRSERLRQQIEQRGIMAVVAIRLLPIAPFSVVNFAAGACSVRLIDFVVGTIIGMLPGLIAISALGRQVATTITDFSFPSLALLLLLILAWIAMAAGVQFLLHRWLTRRRVS
jgi:phosphatidylserine/phosphatidylglycerophosphate/cardiolipin synthase-like enzyme/uncharacterized membrane protein YdjX (TVP38/TMEM64 family)